MGEDTRYMLSCAFRFLLFAASSHGAALYFTKFIFERKRSLRVLIIYLVTKIFIVNIFLAIIIKGFYNDYYVENVWIRAIYTMSTFLAAVVSYVLFAWTFKGRLTNIMVGALITEWMGAFASYFSLVIINKLEGRTAFEDVVEFQFLDIGIPLLCCGFAVIAGHFCNPLLFKIRSHEFRHKRLLCAVFISYILLATVTLFQNEIAGSLTASLLLTCMSVLAALLCWKIEKYRRNIKKQRAYMEVQKELLTAHFSKIQEKIQDIEKCRDEVSKKMKVMIGIFEESSNERNIGQFTDYLEDLTREYQRLKAGMYSDDWMLDAVLSSQQEFMEQQGIQLECSAREYLPRQCQAWEYRETQQDLITLLMTLFHWGIKACQGMEDK